MRRSISGGFRPVKSRILACMFLKLNAPFILLQRPSRGPSLAISEPCYMLLSSHPLSSPPFFFRTQLALLKFIEDPGSDVVEYRTRWAVTSG
jgi:hypothetical protein